jgi:TPR repeat protein
MFAGVLESYCALGLRYWSGTGVEEDKDEAFKWFLKGAEFGHADSELNAGNYLLEKKQYERAKDFFESSAMRGCARAMASLGDIYKRGFSVPVDIDKARKLYQKAKDNGYNLNVQKELDRFDVKAAFVGKK